MFEPLQFSFMQRAIITALLLSPICALMGVFVIARKMSFFSDTIGHSALAGVAVGLLIGLKEPLTTLLITSLAVAIIVFWLREKTELLTDTIMALMFSGMIAVAIIIFSFLKGYKGDLHRYLFGDILAVGNIDTIASALLFVLMSFIIFKNLNQFTLVTTNEELAFACGVNVGKANYLFVITLTLTVALSIRLLGIMLVTSLLVVPAAAARNVSVTLRQQLIFSILFGLFSALAGTLSSYYLNLPSGPCITLACILVFILTLIWKKVKE